MKNELWKNLLTDRVTTFIGVCLVIFLATRWNTMSREEIIFLAISSLVHGVSRDPKLANKEN